jgi:hypothetical protein
MTNELVYTLVKQNDVKSNNKEHLGIGAMP